MPQVAGTRKCSLWAKADVGDWWLKQVFGGRPFRQIMGLNADEEGRRLGDQVTSKMPGRTGEFPLIDWGWTRQQCEAYLLERFDVHWPKSYCTFCFMWNQAKASATASLPGQSITLGPTRSPPPAPHRALTPFSKDVRVRRPSQVAQ
ncbi:hypothetical protein [Streptomyces sp. NPDC057280]|uniref:hypothetical protein n=1 Tax=Streptomyces sp. NPDC057280 TaxID=3346081 RepID=UPI00362B4E35